MKGIIIGRFQGFHNGHQDLILNALRHLRKEGTDHLHIYVGSAQESRTKKNPFTFFERKALILDIFKNRGNLQILPLFDKQNDEVWKKQILRVPGDVLFGNLKDESSYYLTMFPEIQLVSFPQCLGLSATRVREEFYQDKTEIKFVPEETQVFLEQFKQLHPEEYKQLCE